jgi:phosphatidylglycerophosphate synthase
MRRMSSEAEDRRHVVVDLRESGLGSPLTRVCGMAALERTLLVLGRQGYTHALLVVRPGGADRAEVERALPRAASALTLRFLEETDTSLRPLLEALDGEGARDALFWPANLSFGRHAPGLAKRRAPEWRALWGTREGERPGPTLLDLNVLRGHEALTWAEIETQLSQSGQLEPVELDLEPLDLARPGARKRAVRALLASLRKDEDGVVARFDRHVSLSVSRFLMKLPVHPNAATIGAALLAVSGAIVAAHGGYWWMLAAALLFQLNSILDGIDGEIARAKLLESRTGQWADTLSDDFSNVVFIAGTAVGCQRTWGSSHYLVLGAIAVAGFVITAAIMYHYLITVAHSGDLNAFRMPWERYSRIDKPREAADAGRGDRPRPGVGLLERLEPFVRRDFFVLATTAFALVGQLRVMMWFYALGATGVWTSIVGYRLFGPRQARGPAGGAGQ